MNVAQKIRMVLGAKNMNLSQLAKLLNTSQSNLWKKMDRDNFSDKEIAEISEVLGVKVDFHFIMEDGTKI